MIIAEREFDIYEVRLALLNAAEILKMIPETLDHFLGNGRRGEEPDHEHHLLLLMAIKGLIPRLRQADEFLDSTLDAENRKLLKELDEIHDGKCVYNNMHLYFMINKN